MFFKKIVQTLQNMDVLSLEKLMVAESYDGASKEIYLKKIETLFDELRAGGDAFLEVYPGYCNCKGDNFCGNSISLPKND